MLMCIEAVFIMSVFIIKRIKVFSLESNQTKIKYKSDWLCSILSVHDR